MTPHSPMRTLRLAFSRLRRLNGPPRLTGGLPNLVLADLRHHVHTFQGAADFAEFTDAPIHLSQDELVQHTLALVEAGRPGWEEATPARTMALESSATGSVSLADLAEPLDLTPEYAIIIELIGEDDRPVPGVEYGFTLPNGSTRAGSLDSEGRAEFLSLTEPGDCKIRFPTLDRDAWEYIHATPI